LNYAWRVVYTGNGAPPETTSVFVKQAPGFIKCLGADESDLEHGGLHFC